VTRGRRRRAASARSPFVESERRRRRRGGTRLRDRLAVFTFALGALAAIVGLAFLAGYIVGKLIL
jgi:hypothetical protein